MNRIKRRIAKLLLVLVLITQTGFASTLEINDARSYIIYNMDSDKVIASSNNINQTVPIASVSKLMTFYITLNKLKSGEISLDDEVIIKEEDCYPTGNRLGIKPGETYSLKRLMEIMMTNSCNDVTAAIARHVAGSEAKFVSLMNNKAKELGYENAAFYNAHGLPRLPDLKQNSMSAMNILDLSKRIVNEHPNYIDFTMTKAIDYPQKDYHEDNTNPLFGKEGITGLKTGTTRAAGNCFVCTFYKKGDGIKTKDNHFISVMLGAKTSKIREEISKKLVDYAKDNYSNKILLSKKNNSKLIEDLNDYKEEKLLIECDKEYSQSLMNSFKTETKLRLKDSLNYDNIIKGDILGQYIVYVDGTEVFKSNAIAMNGLTRKNIFDKIYDFFMNIWNL